MTLSTTTSRIEYAGDGSTVTFAIPFPFLSNADIAVTNRAADGTETPWTNGSEFTLTGAGSGGGTLTVVTSPVDHTPVPGDTLIVRRVVAETQPASYPEGGVFPAAAHEQSLDRLTMIAQQHSEELERAIVAPVADGVTAQLPRTSIRAGKYLGFDTNGDPVALDAPAGTTTASTFGASLIVAANGDAARGLLGVPGQNLLDNGAFAITQRGLVRTATTAALYGPDRWLIAPGSGGSPSVTATVKSVTAGAADVPGQRLLLDWNQTAAATSIQPALIQRLPGVQALQSRTVTISGWVRVISGSPGVLSFGVFQSLANGGVGDTSTVMGTFTPTSTWTRFSATVTVPSTSGKTVGNGAYTQFFINFPTSATFRVEIAHMKLELGSVATDFVEVPYAHELVRCLRYYQQSYSVAVAAGTATNNGAVQHMAPATNVRLPVPFGVPMRAAPTVTIYSTDTGTSGQLRDLVAGADVAASAVSIGTSGFYISAGLAGGERHIRAHYTADAEI